jgi:phage terminase large subunit-like protein
MAANAQLKGDRPDNGAWDQAQLGLRLGHPHSIASTTPRNTRAYKEVRQLADHIRHATIFDNAANLPESFLERMRKRYEGTRLGRQELYGELLTDVAGALWTMRVIDAGRILNDVDVPDLVRSVVAVDPAATSGPNADDTGIIVIALGVDWELYVLEDRTCHLDPDGWGQRAVRAYRKHKADMIVAEVNNGGEMVEHVIATADPRVPVKTVHASRGKAIRAQPIASLYGNPPKREPRVHHVGAFPELEDQLTTWVPGEENSPDRLDALVWGATELLLEETEDISIEEDYEPVSIGPDV